jgi:hypothetical protein
MTPISGRKPTMTVIDPWDKPTPYRIVTGGNKTLILEAKNPIDLSLETLKATTTELNQLTKALNRLEAQWAHIP